MGLIFTYQPARKLTERLTLCNRYPQDSAHCSISNSAITDNTKIAEPIGIVKLFSRFGKHQSKFSVLLCFVLTLFFNNGNAQTASFTLDTIPYSDLDILAPGRGANTFYTYNQVLNIPDPSTSTWSLDNETRFNWSELQSGAAGQYNWSSFDNQINYSIDRNQRFSFGVMCLNADGGTGSFSADGGTLSYPLYIHQAMQKESTPDWKYGSQWIPNWNSENFLSGMETFLRALNDHINSTSYKGIPYKNVVYRIDIRGFGNWGEWHSYPFINNYPTSAHKATVATLKRIIDIHTSAFPNFPLIANINMFVGEIPNEVGYYALTASNNWGKLGIRNDHFGWTSTYLNDITNNTRSYNEINFKSGITNQYRVAPIVGEPMNSSSAVLDGGSCGFWNFENEVRTYHASQFNNQNGSGLSGTCVTNNYLSASKACGYRVQVKSGSASNTGGGLAITLNWSNIGVAPTYENWDTWYELRDGSTVVWSGKSSFTPKLFLPGTQTVTENFAVPVQGNYGLYVIVRDPTGYRKPLTLTNKNRASDGSYLLTYVNVSATTGQSPVANAGANQTITLPANSVTLDGSNSKDGDGSITTYAWSKVSGPTQGTITSGSNMSTTATNLAQGTYIFKLTVTDNSNFTGSDSVTITVNALANQQPVANAGANQTISLPASSATLDGSASSDPDGTISTYTWSKISGPSQGTITSGSSASTTVTNLAAGTYIFKLTVKDNGNATATDSVTVTVNSAVNKAPVANAGSNQSVTLPANSVTLNGSGSSDPDGSISSYTWSKVSGPAQGTISNSTAASTAATNLAQGTYTFKLTVKDNSNATASDSVIITVNAAAAQAPVANAGSNQTITLPANSIALNGSASSDADGTITTYTWSKVSGPAQGSISNTSAASTSATNLVQGTYVFRLTIKDNSNLTAFDEVTITVNGTVNQAPVANAGANQTVTLPTNSVALNGTASSDADGSVTSYTWLKAAGPAQGSISNTTAAATTAANLVQGTYVFRLTVKDNGNATATDSVIITVNPAPNQPPVADAGTNQTITLPLNSVTLNATASSDADGSIASYSWVKLAGGTVSISNANSSSATVTNLQAGQYTFVLTVTDNNGASSKDTVNVNVVSATEQNPVADAGKNQTITLPVNSVTLNGSGSLDPDGTISAYEWVKSSGPAQGGITNANQATTTANNLVAGTYVFRLTVTDNSGNKGADSVIIVVRAATNKSPKANAGSSRSMTLPTNSTSLDGTASSDDDGTIVSYDWKKLTGGTATIGAASSAQTAVSGLVAGQYTFELTVTDNQGATGTAEIKITVTNPANQPPVANAGSNKIVTLPTNTVQLDGSASTDADGTIASYSWAKIAGGTVTITNNTTAKPTVSGLQQGQYTFELTVTDNRGAATKAQVKVTVNVAPNQAPVANAGANQTITLPVNTVKLNGSNSVDPDGTIASYSWAKIAGAAVTITNGTTATPTVSGLTEGQYTFELTVKDNTGATTKAQVKVTVIAAPNQPPVANAGANLTLPYGTAAIVLDGSKSSDPDGTIVSYSWTKVSGADVIMANGNTSKPSVSGLQGGQYTFELTVTDNRGATAKAQVKISVNLSSNQPPVANAGPNQNVTLPANSAKLDGSVSSDPDGTIAAYSWTRVNGPSAVTIANVNTATPTVSGLVAGQYTFELTVTDNRGVSTIAQVKITVKEGTNELPIADAGPDQTVTLPLSGVKLDGTKSLDPDGTIVSYTWMKIDGASAVTIKNVNTATPTVSGLQPGQYIFELTVKDNKGATAKDQVIIIVKPSPDAPPVANAGGNITLALPTTATVLDGSFSYDTQGGLLTFSWQQVRGPSSATMTGNTERRMAISDLEAGEYVFQLTVTNSRGIKATDQAKVTVIDESQTPATIELYPNPASDVINVKISSDSIGVVALNIYNLNGAAVKKVELNKQLIDNLRQQVQRRPVNSTQSNGSVSFFVTPVNIAQLGKGVYIIETIVDRRARVTSKFVKY